MKARAVVALAALFLQPWIAANDRAVSAIRDPHARAAQRALFARTQAQLHAAEHSASQPATDAAALAREILANHRRFSIGAVQKAPPKTFWERLQDWIGARWEALIKALFGRARLPGNFSAAIGDVMLPLSLLAFLAIVVRLAWQYGRRSEPSGRAEFALDPSQNASALAARARQRADSGEYTAAVTLLFSAALHTLAARGIVDAGDARTVGELRRAVKRRAAHLSGAFSALAMLLTRAVYADAVLERADWDAAVQAYASLRRVQGDVDAA